VTLGVNTRFDELTELSLVQILVAMAATVLVLGLWPKEPRQAPLLSHIFPYDTLTM